MAKNKDQIFKMCITSKNSNRKPEVQHGWKFLECTEVSKKMAIIM
jgi:hypothetical protein